MNSSPHEESLFQAASSLAGAERAAFLDRESARDPALRARLEALLAAHEQPDTLFGTEAGGARPTIHLDLAHDLADDLVGRTIGRYKLIEKIGEGGCGVVYVAEQTEPVRRRVALKIIKLGMDTKQVVARFEAERQALAMMDHPNIAKVLDAGTTDCTAGCQPAVPQTGSLRYGGRPYFVMELVRGIKITDYCDQEQLNTRDRLDLFIKVCHAIQHAHQKGIIHRDIKPSNILVTLHDGVPAPKVIDFGIAKAMEGRLTDATVDTQLHQFMGTPAYMSPEQAEMTSLDIDTRSDIYSLGVLLYELLTGVTPFDPRELMSQGIDAMRRTIREQEPVRPSTRLTQLRQQEQSQSPIAPSRGQAAKARSEIRNQKSEIETDLDWIVMKCLEKDRGRRYETASDVAAELNRHLSNEPVAARPPSAAYRLQKSFRRHRVACTAGAAVALALVGGLGVSLWQADQATRARNTAEAERARTESALAREAIALAAATQANQTLETALSKEQRSAYARGIALAHQAWLADQVARADRILMETGPEKLRGFEWSYLRGLCQGRGALRFEGRLGGHRDIAPVSSSGATQLAVVPGDTGHSVLDAATREEIFRPAAGSSLARWSALALSPTGEVLAVAERSDSSPPRSGRIMVLDRRSGRELRAITVRPLRRIRALAFSPDGRLVAAALSMVMANAPRGVSASAGGHLAWWNVASGDLQHSTPPSSNSVARVAFTPDGSRIVNTGPGGSLDVWETATGKLHRIARPEDRVPFGNLWALSPDGRHAAMCAAPGGGVRFVDLRTGEETLGCFGHAATISALAYSQDGKWFAAGSLSGSVRVWDTTTFQQVGLFRHPWPVIAIGFSPDGRGLFVGNLGTYPEQAEYLRWDLAAYQDRRELQHHKTIVRTTTFSHDMQVLASSSVAGEIVLWDIVNHRPSATLRGHQRGPCVVALSPVDPRVATGGSDATVRIWDRRSGELLHSASDHDGWVGTVAYSPDGALIASAGAGGTVKVRNGHTGKVVYEFRGHKSASSRALEADTPTVVSTVVFSPDGREIASVGSDRRVRVWGAITGEERLVLDHGGMLSSVAYRPDGRVLATAGGDLITAKGDVKLWDAASGEEVLTLQGPLEVVSAVAFSPDGQRIAATSTGSVRIFDAVSGLELLALEGAESDVAFSPDGRFLAAGGLDGVVRLWDGTPLPVPKPPN